MGVKVTKREYSEAYTNGKTDWLLGNVGDWQNVLLEVEAGVEFLASQQSPLQIDYVNNAIILSNGDNWGQHGFDIGMTMTLSYKKSVDSNGDGTFDQINTVTNDYTVTNVYENVMEVEEDLEVDGFENIPTNFGSKKITEVAVYSVADIEGCKLRYGHIPNDDQSENLQSVIDGTTTEFIFPGLNQLSAGNWGDMEPVGKQSGMSISRARIRAMAGSQSSILTTINDFGNANEDFVGIERGFGTEFKHIRSIGLKPAWNVNALETSVSELVATDNTTGNIQSSPFANPNTAFWFDSLSGHQQQFFMNIDVRITNTAFIVPTAQFKLVLIKYANGSQMTFVEKRTLQSWVNPQVFINDQLNFNGIVDIDINPHDSLVLAFEFTHDPDNDINTQDNVIWYKVEDVFIQVAYQNQEFAVGSNKTYQISIDYMISSLFENLANLQNLEMPSYLTGDGSLTDNFLLKFFPEWNNPNVQIQNDPKETKRLGNTGWFNENFNQLDNNFSIDSVRYYDEDNHLIDALDYTKPTRVKVVINGVPNLSSFTRFGFGFAWVPVNPDDYKNKETPFHQNVFLQTGKQDDGFWINSISPGPFYGFGVGGSAMDVSDIEFREENGKVRFEMVLSPNSNFSALFDSKSENDRNYGLWVSVADSFFQRNFSDRVSLLVDVNNMVKSIPPAGAYDEIDNVFIEHPFDANVEGVMNYDGYIQDDVLCRLPFRIKSNRSVVFQKMVFGVEARKTIGIVKAVDQFQQFSAQEFQVQIQPTTFFSEDFELERFEVDLSQYPTDNAGVQQFDFNSTRGFKLNSGNNKNWVKINREAELDTSGYNGYLAHYAFKIRYEDWIARENVPNDFFDANELNKGFHNDWFHYLSKKNWVINFFVIVEAVVDGELLRYKNRYNFKFKDYDSNAQLSKIHKYYRNSDNTLLNVGNDPDTGNPLGAVLSNELTRVEIEFEILDDGLWDLNSIYAVTTIEIERGPGIFDMRQLSTVWGSENDNPLKPLPGETKLKMSVDGTGKKLTTSCLVDPALLNDAIKYRITGRVGCYESQTTFDPGLYEFRYEDNYE